MLALPMRPDLLHHAFSPSTPVSDPESCTTQTTAPAAGTMLSLSVMALPRPDHTDLQPPPAKRPKLSLATSTLPLTFDKSTTGLMLAVPTDSPTLRNTYANAYEPHRVSATSFSSPSAKPKSPICRLTSPYPHESPYQLSLGVRSILRNSPLPRRHLSATSARTTRRMFPNTKRVSYRCPLEEIMPAKRPLSEIESPTKQIGNFEETESEPSDSVTEKKPECGSEDDVGIPVMPTRGRRKRRREWVWTLGSLEPAGPNPEDLPKMAEANKDYIQ